jgi:hypothetical protein
MDTITKQDRISAFEKRLKIVYTDLLDLDRDMITLASKLHLDEPSRESLKRNMSASIAGLITILDYFEDPAAETEVSPPYTPYH